MVKQRHRHRTKRQPTRRPAPPLIVKVQRSIFDSEGERRILIYNQDRTVQMEGPETELPEDVRAALSRIHGEGWLKFYTYAVHSDDGVLAIAFDQQAPEQDW